MLPSVIKNAVVIVLHNTAVTQHSVPVYIFRYIILLYHVLSRYDYDGYTRNAVLVTSYFDLITHYNKNTPQSRKR